MENEHQILKSILNNENATQRDIAKSTGMSLGNVNILIKRLVRKGMLQIDRLNPRTIKYIITPRGMKEKLQQTYSYIALSIKYIKEITDKINLLLSRHIINNGKNILLFGENDDIHEMLKNKLNEISTEYKSIYTLEQFEALESERQISTGRIIIVWQPDYMELLENKGVEYINLLESI